MADLSIEETNKLRAALGMPLLPTSNPSDNSGLNFKSANNDSDSSDGSEPASTLDTRQAAAGDNWNKLQAEAVAKKAREAKRAALKKQRDAAQRFAKLEGKGLGDADDDNMDTRSWLLGSKKRQKKIAKERAKDYERELAERERQVQYTEADLKGRKVGHQLDDFEDGAEQVLTLKDQEIGEESEEDELENIEVRDRERLKERKELKKKRLTYDPFADEQEGERSVLAHYDEEIDGKKKTKFTLDGQGSTTEAAAAKTAAGGRAQGQSFNLDFLIDDKPTSDYVDPSEVKIKKPKKKKEKSKRQKIVDDDDILPTPESTVEADKTVDGMDVDGAEAPKSTGNSIRKRPRDDTSFVDDDDLQSNLVMQRMAALKKRKLGRPEDIARQLRQEASATPEVMNTAEDGEDDGLVIDETREFVGNLQRPDVSEPSEKKPKKPSEAPQSPSSAGSSPAPHNDGDIDMKYSDDEGEEDLAARLKRESSSLVPSEGKPPESKMTATGLDNESTIDQGLGSTLSMLTQRGLLTRHEESDPSAQFRKQQEFLQEKHRRFDDAEQKARLQRERDRTSGKFERMSTREREQHAQYENKQRDQVESRQMADLFNKDYKPSVELRHIDEYGRNMTPREAFKHLSHMFHGKGSGNKKIEKRAKKIAEEKKREGQSSLDASKSTGMNTAMNVTSKKYRQAGVRLQ